MSEPGCIAGVGQRGAPLRLVRKTERIITLSFENTTESLNYIFIPIECKLAIMWHFIKNNKVSFFSAGSDIAIIKCIKLRFNKN